MSLKDRDRERYVGGGLDKVLVPEPPVPKNMMIELTNGCNHACVFCTNPHMTRRIGRIDLKLLLRVMREARDLGVDEVGFYTTGDPFVHSGLALVTQEATEMGFRYKYISTNGALATPERVVPVIDAGMSSIKFSINAGSRETYRLIHGKDDWESVIRNLRFISDYRKERSLSLYLAVTCVVTKQIRHEVETITQLFEDIVDEVYFSECTDQVSQMRSALPLLGDPAASQRSAQQVDVCRLPFSRLHVTREGFLTLCCVDYQNYLAIADLNVMSLKDAWYSEGFVEQRKRHLKNELTGTLCDNCWNGNSGQVIPLVPQFATTYNVDAFERRIVDETKERFF